MKHSWAKSDFNAVGELSMYVSKDICRHCGISRFGYFVGKWKEFKYFNGATLYPHRPECIVMVKDPKQLTIICVIL